MQICRVVLDDQETSVFVKIAAHDSYAEGIAEEDKRLLLVMEDGRVFRDDADLFAKSPQRAKLTRLLTGELEGRFRFSVNIGDFVLFEKEDGMFHRAAAFVLTEVLQACSHVLISLVQELYRLRDISKTEVAKVRAESLEQLKELKQANTRLRAQTSLKDEFENDYFPRFVEVLNTKKERIRDLSETVLRLKNQLAAQPLTQTKIRVGEDEEDASDGTDSLASQTRRKMQSGAFHDEDDEFGLQEEVSPAAEVPTIKPIKSITRKRGAPPAAEEPSVRKRRAPAIKVVPPSSSSESDFEEDESDVLSDEDAPLPAGFRRVKSRSKPMQWAYLEIATGRKSFKKPIENTYNVAGSNELASSVRATQTRSTQTRASQVPTTVPDSRSEKLSTKLLSTKSRTPVSASYDSLLDNLTF